MLAAAPRLPSKSAPSTKLPFRHPGPPTLIPPPRRIVNTDSTRAEVTISNPKGEKEQPKVFTFDSAYGVDATQREIYDRTASPIVGA